MVSDDELDPLATMLANEPTITAINVQQVDCIHDRYEKAWLTVKRTADPTLLLPHIQSSHVKSLAALMLMLAFEYRSRMTTVTRSAEYNSSVSAVVHAGAVQDDQSVVKERLQMNLLDGRPHCGTMRQVMEAGGQE